MIKIALVASLILHSGIFMMLAIGLSRSAFERKSTVSIEARLLFKDEAKRDLLPKKKVMPSQPAVGDDGLSQPVELKEPHRKEDVVAVKASIPTEQGKKPTERVKEKKSVKKLAKPNFAGALASLSQSFAEELADESSDDLEHSYFDQVYALIKESFVVPPHINGPAGHRLRAVFRLFLNRDGGVMKLILENSSGDAHFDKAVLEGARRVSSFGEVPLLLQNSLQQRGLVVQICPFKCQEQ